MLDAYGRLLRPARRVRARLERLLGAAAEEPGPVLPPERRPAPDRGRADCRPHELVAGFREAGWLDLTNARGRLEVAGSVLGFVGVDDPHLKRDRYPEPATDIGRAGDVGGGVDAAVTLGVTHAPYRRVLDRMTCEGAALVLAGHTHGGQLCLPFAGALVTNCDLPRRKARGCRRGGSRARTAT